MSVEAADVDIPLFEAPECGHITVSSRFIWRCVAPQGHTREQHYMIKAGHR